MSRQEIFAPFLLEIETALEESLSWHQAAAQRGDFDAMDVELERQKNLINARNQLQVLQELWPRLTGKPKPVTTPEEPMPDRVSLRLEFWGQLLERARGRTELHALRSPSKQYWLDAGAGKSGLSFIYLLRNHDAQVDLYIDRGEREANKRIFDQFSADRGRIDAAFGEPLRWQRLDKKQCCRIQHVIPGGGLRDRERWPEIQERMIDAMVRLEGALRPHIEQL